MRGDRLLDPVLGEVHDFAAVAGTADARDVGARFDRDAFLAKILGQALADIGIFVGEQLSAADDDRRRHADARVELAELAADVTAAEHDQRFRRRVELQRFVALDVAGLRQARKGRRHDRAAGRDNEGLPLEHVVADAQFVRRLKHSLAVEHGERLDTGHPVIGEALNDLALARHHRAEVHRRLAREHAQFVRVADFVGQVAGCDQRLGRHAPAQDAQATERTTVDQGHRRP